MLRQECQPGGKCGNPKPLSMVYKETQPLKRTWLIPFLFVIQLFVGIMALFGGFSSEPATQDWVAFGIVLLVTGLILVLFLSMQLETRLDA